LTRFLLRRLLGLAAMLVAASLVVFVVMNVLPGDPALVMLGTGATPGTLAALRHQMGLDLPLWLQYLRWAGGLLRGDFGISYTYQSPVAGLIAARLGVTLPLALMSILLSVSIAIPVGVIAATRRGGTADAALMGAAQLGVAVPNFWLGLLLILVFGVKLGWLPATGFPGWSGGLLPGIAALLMPAVSLALPQAAILARVTRSAVIEAAGEDYVRTARAKGLAARAAIWGHALPNALIPVVTIMGFQFSYLLAGTVVIENVFTLPGMGRLLFQAIAGRDLITVQDIVVLLTASVIVVNTVVDLAYAAIDPRVSVGGASGGGA
jgi:peptide/nickel transport system permease protein